MADLTLDNLSKSFGRARSSVPAVDRLTLHIADGEFVVLVGPSGCGKTTTLRLIAGLEEPTSGAVRIGGREVAGLPPCRRDIAMVFQGYALYPHMTIRRNMGFALRMRGTPKDEVRARVDAAAQMLGITPLLERLPRQLSGGERQRAAVGKAVVREPKVFLFDEPLSNLDARLRAQLRAELKALHQRLKITTVYVTHDQEEAMTLGDRIVVMDRGRVRQVGTPLEVYRHPADRFVAGFIGMPPMNFLEGTLVRDSAGAAFLERGAAAAVPLGIDLSPARAAVVGMPIVLGIRAASLRPTAPNPSAAAGALALLAETVEPLGEHVDIAGLTPAGQRLTARLPASEPVTPGDTLRLRIDPAGVHIFESGEAGAVMR